MPATSLARLRSAAISTISLALVSSCRPNARPGIDGSSGADTQVLRIDNVRADDLDLGGLIVDRRAGEQPLPDALPAARKQRQSHPAGKFSRRGAGSDVAEARGACLARDQVGTVAQASHAFHRAHAHQLQSIGRGKAGALRQRAADVVTLLLEHAPKSQILGAGVAIDLGAGHVTLFDAQRVERIEAVRRDAE